MLKVTAERLEKLETDYPGLREAVLDLEVMTLPGCPHCGSDDTAEVNVDVIGRTITMASATTRFKLVPNGPMPGAFFCNGCQSVFDAGD